MATMVLVTEVPMLAPMIMKMAMLTESSSAPTMETMMEVVVEEDWTSTVASTPIRRAEIGLSATSNILAESLPPRSLKPVPMMERVRRNTQMQKKTARVRAALSFGSSLEGVSHFACLAASRLFVGQAIGDVFDPLLGSLGFLLLDEIRVGLLLGGRTEKFLCKKQLVSYLRTRGVERGGIEVGGKLKLTVNGDPRWQRL